MPAKVLSNLESVGDMVGALSGIADGLNEDDYVEGLIKGAHGHAANAFDVAAAATARSGFLSHVFEFGVPGITPGPSKYADPTSPAARLWIHTIAGHGGRQDIGYSFRPALNRNPQPTTRSTGVPSRYLRRLSSRKYVFSQKAFVMETGQTVQIKSDRGNGFVFVPFYGEPSDDPRNKRGYMMWNSKRLGPITAVPGRDSKGQFTAFWMNWWGGAGSSMMDAEMRKRVTTDIEVAMAEAAKKANAHPLKPAQTTNIPGAFVRAKNFMNKLFGAKTKAESMERVV